MWSDRAVGRWMGWVWGLPFLLLFCTASQMNCRGCGLFACISCLCTWVNPIKRCKINNIGRGSEGGESSLWLLSFSGKAKGSRYLKSWAPSGHYLEIASGPENSQGIQVTGSRIWVKSKQVRWQIWASKNSFLEATGQRKKIHLSLVIQYNVAIIT